MPATTGLRIVLAEDSVLLREGLIGLMARFGHRVVAAVSEADSLRDAVQTHDPDVVVTDVRMPPGFRDEGLRVAVELRRIRPGLPILVLSQYVETVYATELLNVGDGTSLGYLLKDRIGQVEEFLDALNRVVRGDTIVDPEVVRQMLRRRRNPLGPLTAREREVLALVAEGRSNAAIAAGLVVTEAAIAKHIRSIFHKLDLPQAEENHRRVLAVLTFLRS
ncbi:response regulator [Micromonospora saelicesensis]|uniref:response regulator n=2 Tax=Micromonospora saelicesensis TaxID=285676 RepID=UPI000DC01771|nr:response regulator transcription factor [Micromonospora saelicesensis]RAO50898.1 Non-specific serine/threonine protein kinase [Micromonospora saelicesensis]RAO53536.1 Non-specific serine/threonine protein kinase [Micromonospora saelicesensis]